MSDQQMKSTADTWILTGTWRMAYWVSILVILVTSLFLRLWRLDILPPGFHFDEAFEGLEAWRILTEPSYRPIFLTGNFGVPPLNSYANAVMFGLWRSVGFAVGPTAMRATAACIGLFGVLALWALAHELRHPTTRFIKASPLFPLVAIFVLGTMRWHVHFSRMGIEPIFVPFVWATSTACILHGWRTGRMVAFLGSAIFLAAGMYAYQGAWVVPFLMVITVLILFVHTTKSRRRGDLPSPSLHRLFVGTALTAGVALLLVAPLGWFFFQNIDLVFLRPAQLSIVGATTSPADSNVLASVWATAKMFGPFGMPGDGDPRRNLPGAPALSIWYALPFYLGLAISILRIRRPGSQIILLGLFGLLLPGVVSEYAPHFHRILGATAPTALLCAVGLDGLWQWRPHRWPRMGFTVSQWAVILLLLLGAMREAHNYFVRWAALPDLFHAFDVGLWTIGQQIAMQPADAPIYLTPRANDHATLAFAWSTITDAHHAPIPFDGRQIFPLTAGHNGTDEYYVVIEHEDFRTRLLWPGLFANAPVVTTITDGNGAIYAQTYQRPAGTAMMREPQFFLHDNHSVESLGDGIALLGYDVQPAVLTPGQILYLQLYWQVDRPPSADWTVFTHLLQQADDGGFTLLAGRDSRPGGGSLPTPRWQQGWLILDEYQIALPPDLPPGHYTLATGLYQPSGEQLPAPDKDGASRVVLGTVEIE